MSPEQTQRLSQLRATARSRELTLEETREAIVLMRQDRVTASQVSAKSRAKPEAVNSDKLLDELEGM
jgi:hypothetical protein